MRVEEIKKMKSGKYKVKIEGEDIVTYDDVILDNHLLYKKEIDEEAYKKIALDSIHAEIYHKALAYALKKVRSTFELEHYLDKFDITEIEKNQIVEHLKAIGILSDVAYVKAYISDSLYLSNDGPNKIKEHLIAQGIEETLIMDELDKMDIAYVREKLDKLIQKKMNHDHKHSNYQLKQKITVDMVNLGYDRDMITEILSSVTISDSDKLEAEYGKIYQKLCKKYDNEELFWKIQEKLYSKGFDIHDIETLIHKKKSEI